MILNMHPKHVVFFSAILLFFRLNSIRTKPMLAGAGMKSGDTMRATVSAFEEGRAEQQAGNGIKATLTPPTEFPHGGSGVGFKENEEFDRVRGTGSIDEGHGEGLQKLGQVEHENEMGKAAKGSDDRHWEYSASGLQESQEIVSKLKQKTYQQMTPAELQLEIKELKDATEYMWAAYKNSPGKGSWMYRKVAVPIVRTVTKWLYNKVVENNAKAAEYLSKEKYSKAVKKMIGSNKEVVRMGNIGKKYQNMGWDVFTPSALSLGEKSI